MILIDTSVWLDFFNATGTKTQLHLRHLIEEGEDIAIDDIILAEILQGIKSEKDFKRTKKYLLELPVYSLKNTNSYIEAAQIYRACRRRGLTVRKLIDCLIARTAIENDLCLFHNDKDFNAIATVVCGFNIYSY